MINVGFLPHGPRLSLYALLLGKKLHNREKTQTVVEDKT